LLREKGKKNRTIRLINIDNEIIKCTTLNK
jgi:hypothetical protein